MLIITRYCGEIIWINDDIKIKILDIPSKIYKKGQQVKIGIEAPSNVSIHREEIYLKIKAENEIIH